MVALTGLVGSASQLRDVWDGLSPDDADLLNEGYPPGLANWDEVVDQLQTWLNVVKAKQR